MDFQSTLLYHDTSIVYRKNIPCQEKTRTPAKTLVLGDAVLAHKSFVSVNCQQVKTSSDSSLQCDETLPSPH